MNEASPLKCLPVQLDELAYALYESSEAEAAHYLDLETDEVIRLTAEMRGEADEISASLEADVENVDAAFEAALASMICPTGWWIAFASQTWYKLVTARALSLSHLSNRTRYMRIWRTLSRR